MKSARRDLSKMKMVTRERQNTQNVYMNRSLRHIENGHVKNVVEDLLSRGVISGSSSMFFVLCGDDYENESSEDVTILVDDYDHHHTPENESSVRLDQKTIQFFNRKSNLGCRSCTSNSYSDNEKPQTKTHPVGRRALSCEKCQEENENFEGVHDKQSRLSSSYSHGRSGGSRYVQEDYNYEDDELVRRKKQQQGSYGQNNAEEQYNPKTHVSERSRNRPQKKSDVIKRYEDEEEYAYYKRDKNPRRYRETEMPTSRSNDSLQYNVMDDSQQYYKDKELQMQRRSSYRSRNRDAAEYNWESNRNPHYETDRRYERAYGHRRRPDDLYNVTVPHREDEVAVNLISDVSDIKRQSNHRMTPRNVPKNRLHNVPGASGKLNDCEDVMREIKRCVGAISQMTNTLSGIQQGSADSKDASTIYDYRGQFTPANQYSDDIPTIIYDSRMKEQVHHLQTTQSSLSLRGPMSSCKVVRYSAPSPGNETRRPILITDKSSIDSSLECYDHPTRLVEDEENDSTKETCNCKSGAPSEGCRKALNINNDSSDEMQVEVPYDCDCDRESKTAAFCGLKFYVGAKGAT